MNTYLGEGSKVEYEGLLLDDTPFLQWKGISGALCRWEKGINDTLYQNRESIGDALCIKGKGVDDALYQNIEDVDMKCTHYENRIIVSMKPKSQKDISHAKN